MAHTGNLARGKVAMQVEQMRLEVLQRFTLREIIRKLIQMAEPSIAVLSVGESELLHGRHPIALKLKCKPLSIALAWKNEIEAWGASRV